MENKTTLKEFASSYEGGAKSVKNVSELEVVNISYPITEKKGTDSNGVAFTYHVVEFNHEDYRIPKSMIAALKENLKVRPDLENFKIIRTGTTKDDTKYTFVGL